MTSEQKKIILQRFIHSKVTFGKLTLEWLNNHPDIYTIELPWKDNQKDISCIPQGIYNCIPYNSNDFPNTYAILNVPGRVGVLFHHGNFACDVFLSGKSYDSNTKGCILPGFGIEEVVPMVSKSKPAMDYLREVIGKDNFILEVRN